MIISEALEDRKQRNKQSQQQLSSVTASRRNAAYVTKSQVGLQLRRINLKRRQQIGEASDVLATENEEVEAEIEQKWRASVHDASFALAPRSQTRLELGAAADAMTRKHTQH